MGNKDQHLVTLTVAGRNCGVWNQKSGGAVDSDDNKWRPGGMGRSEAQGGAVTVENVALTRLLKRSRDADLIRFLYSQAGRGRVRCSDQLLDADGLPYGRPFVYTGVLKKVGSPGGADSNASTPETYQIEISTDSEIG